MIERLDNKEIAAVLLGLLLDDSHGIARDENLLAPKRTSSSRSRSLSSVAMLKMASIQSF
jgi:hypothetical protein